MRLARRVCRQSRRSRARFGAFVVGVVGLSTGVLLLVGMAYIGAYFHALRIP